MCCASADDFYADTADLPTYEQIQNIINSEFNVTENFIDHDIPTFYIRYKEGSKEAFLRLVQKLEHLELVPLLRKNEEKVVLRVVAKPPVKPSRIQAVDHVHLEAPSGLDDALYWFYGEVGCLQSVPCDTAEASELRFTAERLELRIRIVECPRIESFACRITLQVPSLAEAAEQLEERSVAYERLSGVTFTDRRLATHDPAGNRVELKQQWPHLVL